MVENRSLPANARIWCSGHYRRQRRRSISASYAATPPCATGAAFSLNTSRNAGVSGLSAHYCFPIRCRRSNVCGRRSRALRRCFACTPATAALLRWQHTGRRPVLGFGQRAADLGVPTHFAVRCLSRLLEMLLIFVFGGMSGKILVCSFHQLSWTLTVSWRGLRSFRWLRFSLFLN